MAGILLQGDGVTDEERAAYARSLVERGREAASLRKKFHRPLEGDARSAASRIDGEVLDDRVIEAGGYWSGHLRLDEHLRIIDLEGRQAVDFLCYDAADTTDRYNAANTIKVNGSIFLGRDTVFYSDAGKRMLTIIEDTVGFHDTIGGCCSTPMNYLRYGIKDTPSCFNNFSRALAEHGLGRHDIVANVNFFMYVPVFPSGSTAIVEGASEPGDYVDLRADMDLLCAISNCPQIYNPCNGWTPSPIRLITWRTAG